MNEDASPIKYGDVPWQSLPQNMQGPLVIAHIARHVAHQGYRILSSTWKKNLRIVTLPETNIALKNRPSQKETPSRMSQEVSKWLENGL